ncbi:hypothetical protein HWQ46_00375 [Shewanella sp. D64]|uniref:zonular occludens toxin domain-containing protein n=1 Tax=unclassified Shewanella TaxID=196818 RepID=UPI0022BA259B|nr:MULTISPECIES: zonular occludens toxin domain-containing protein [unclassified Shewanella]MEC4724007.1 hypothetical protein [Shewanella sp. D64]MEC4736027.1 hypothetical protein [Shewanella sp. E94]WBJ98027.1 hypothetical protein HWQ47_13480 [Shewanella sp. MTB7]WBJ98038.1 hypothetical protein HWQ47_13535 [Shewanella sp. MTB7]
MISFRYGGNGSYKTAYGVWFEIIPALKAGRLVVSNIEGLKSLESIEKLLGITFPSSARLIRIFSRSSKGLVLWQNWFNWMPIGALVVIDECQDIFSKSVGFKMEKTIYKGVDSFLPDLPADFSEYFYSRWQIQDPSKFDEGDTDDSGATQLDTNNRLLYPDNFYGAFMRHRKYQWDIVLLTPDYTSIDSGLKGCAQTAYAHRSTDSFFRKRRPRIFSHLPTVTSAKPSKSDYASVTSVKIPLEVFALYKSTGTGSFNASLADLTMLKQPKLILAFVIAIGALVYIGVTLYGLYFSSPEAVAVAAPKGNEQVQTAQASDDVLRFGLSETDKTSIQNNPSVVIGDGYLQANSVGIHPVNPFTRHFPNFDNSIAVYISAVNKTYAFGGEVTDYLFRFDSKKHSKYISSAALDQLGYTFFVIDDCIVNVTLGSASQLVLCPPVEPVTSVESSEVLVSDSLPSFDIFSDKKEVTQ